MWSSSTRSSCPVCRMCPSHKLESDEREFRITRVSYKNLELSCDTLCCLILPWCRLLVINPDFGWQYDDRNKWVTQGSQSCWPAGTHTG
jgi:hypothetical protein